ncbi:MAG: molybdopterin-binding/glycosyltransferase family 2 protein [Pseudomonadota bacterium]
MKFGSFPLDDAVGGILAHTLRLPDDSVIRKGTVLDDELIDVMHAASMVDVVVALPEPGDVLEDEAAVRISSLFSSDGLRIDEARTGRVNFFARFNGIFRVSAEIIDQINSIDPGITLATLPDYTEVNEGRMVATVKIIPYAVTEESLNTVDAVVQSEAISVLPFSQKKIGLVQTLLPGTRQKVLQKTRKVLERRLALSGSVLVDEQQVFHTQEAVSEAIGTLMGRCDMLILFGASAISDIDDVIPQAIRRAGGQDVRFGMPVDPGNLLLLSELDGKPVLGAPGCARGPAENGFDWVLQRLLADIPVSACDISMLGVGGLLMETGARPHPREKSEGQASKIAALVLAAGQSRRMGDDNKMTVDFHGKPMVRHAVEAAAKSQCDDVFVVTGYDSGAVQEAISDVQHKAVFNPNFDGGLSTSLSAGINALVSDYTAALVLLGDMPFVSELAINKLLETAKQNPGFIVVATCQGKRGNPVLWPARHFSELVTIDGDVGARHLIGMYSDQVIEVELGDLASIDIDTPTALSRYAQPPE